MVSFPFSNFGIKICCSDEIHDGGSAMCGSRANVAPFQDPLETSFLRKPHTFGSEVAAFREAFHLSSKQGAPSRGAYFPFLRNCDSKWQGIRGSLWKDTQSFHPLGGKEIRCLCLSLVLTSGYTCSCSLSLFQWQSSSLGHLNLGSISLRLSLNCSGFHEQQGAQGPCTSAKFASPCILDAL